MQPSNLRRRRGILLLIPILAVTAILLITSPVARDAYVQFFPPPPPLPSSYFPAPGEISRWLQEEDRRYQLVVDKRHAFAKKLGDNIKSFPTDGKTHLLWDFFPPAFPCPHRTERVGALGDGGKWVCGMEVLERQERCVVYSFGISTESSFEAEILERAPGCHVWGYDFSVNNFGPEISRQPQLLERATFHKWGLGAKDEVPHTGKPQMYTLRSLMRMNGHDFIDVLKIDIEGAEFGALAALLDDVGSELDGSATPTTPPLPFGQLQIEIHADYPHGDYATFTRWWEALETAGLRPFQAEPNLPYVNVYHRRPDYAEYSFINIRGGHPLIVG